MESMTLTLAQAKKLCAEYGWRIDVMRLANGISSGIYPFGRQLGRGETGRRTFEIFRTDLIKYLEEHSYAH